MGKVLGVGNALVDLLVKAEDDALLKTYNLPKGTMQLVDKDRSDKLSQEIEQMNVIREPGGSAANTINGLAKLGVGSGFIGSVGNDELGNFFKNRMEQNGVEAKLNFSDTGTGKAITFITKDSERTFATYLGAAIELGAKNLNRNMFSGYNYMHIEGYLVQNHELIEKAMNIAKGQKIKTSLDLASFNIVHENRDFLAYLLENYVDIVFANEDEARALTMEEPEKALEELAQYADIAVVKIGAEGSLIRYQDTNYRIASFKTDVQDTTGAGDLYASGFLYGMNKNMSIDRCGQIGAFMASKVIEEVGAHIHDDRWPTIDKMLDAVIQ